MVDILQLAKLPQAAMVLVWFVSKTSGYFITV